MLIFHSFLALLFSFLLIPVSTESLFDDFSILKDLQHSLDAGDTQKTSEILTDYAQRLFYSEWNTSETLMTSLYFFRVASDLGNPRAQFYSSLLHYFELDGTFNIKAKLFDKTENQTVKENMEKYSILKKYIKTRNQKLSFTYSYFSSLAEEEKSILNLGYRYQVVKSFVWFH